MTPEQRKKYNDRCRDRKRERMYGVTPEDVASMLKEQEFKCGICGCLFDLSPGGRGPRANTLCVDHDHETGKVRGLLCSVCNMGIGKLKDSVLLLRNAILWLEKPK